MLKKSCNREIIHFEISSDEANIDTVIRHSCSFLEENAVKPSLEFKIVLRELMRNAIVHGNKLVTEKNVEISICRMGREYFKLTVQDQGEGFDFTTLSLKTPCDPRRMFNRGYYLINELAEGMKFCNDGRTVSIILKLNCASGSNLTV